MRGRGTGMALAGAAAFLPRERSGFPGELDWSFGKVTTPIPLGVPWSQARVELAATPDGGSVVAEGHTVVRYRADGKLETGFGSDGVREVVLPRAVDFEVGDLAVDPEGKVVVIGTATRLGSARQAPPSFAAVVRYLPDGTLDPDFGGGRGYVMGRFGLGSGRGAPAVTASLGAVSPRGWITMIVGTIGRTPPPAAVRRSSGSATAWSCGSTRTEAAPALGRSGGRAHRPPRTSGWHGVQRRW